MPAETSERTPEQWSRWRLAYLLDWHRREAKAVWWEYYRLVEMPEEDLFDEPSAVAGLEFVERVEIRAQQEDRQTHGFGRRSLPIPAAGNGNSRRRRCEADRRRQVWRGRSGRPEPRGRWMCGKERSTPRPIRQRSLRTVTCRPRSSRTRSFGLARRVATGADATLVQRLLRADPPTLRTVPFAARDTESAVEFAVRIANELDNTVLAIQGPPGAGKTFTGARMICALVEQGKRVGVTATSHKVIRNLLDDVAKMSATSGIATRLAQKVGEREEERNAGGAVTEVEDNDEALSFSRTAPPMSLVEPLGFGPGRTLPRR